MKRIFIVLAGAFLWVPCILSEETSAPPFRLPSWDDLQNNSSNLLLKMDEPGGLSAGSSAAGTQRGLLVPDSLVFSTKSAQVSNGSSLGAQLQGRKSNHDHSYLIELTAANWHPLSPSEKADLFLLDLLHWETHTSLAMDAGLSLAINDRPFLGRGGYGFLRRYGFNVADEANSVFFEAFLFPTLFHEDPRYIPQDHGTKRSRIAYAFSRVILTRNDAGGSEINKSLILGTLVSSAISSAYYSPAGGSTGVGILFANVGISLASDAGFNLFKEYWPNVSRKLKMNVWIRNLIRSSVRDTIRVY